MQDLVPSLLQENLRTLVESKRHVSPLLDDSYDAMTYRSEISSIARACPQTALAFGMHLYQMWSLRIRHPDIIARYRSDIVEGGLLCSLNDPGTYFCGSGELDYEKYPVKAVRVKGGYRVSGRKAFSSLSNFVSFIPVTALAKAVDGRNRLVSVFIKRDDGRIKVEDDWDSIAMPDTGTNSIWIEDVFVPDEDVMHVEHDERWASREVAFDLDLFLYRLHICSTYEAISDAAFDIVEREFKDTRSPAHRLIRLPHPQYQMSELFIKREQNRACAVAMCRSVDDYVAAKTSYETMNVTSLAFKESITSTAEQAVNLAMAIVGIRSVSRKHPLSALYCNVKAGRFHPPQPASAHEIIAKTLLGLDLHVNPRWDAGAMNTFTHAGGSIRH